MLCSSPESNPRQKKFFFARSVLPGIEPAPFVLRTDSSQLRYMTLVVIMRTTALELGSVRTSGSLLGSFLPKKLNLFWFWPIHIFLSRKTCFNTHHFDADVAISFEAGLKCGCPPILRACADPPETANLRERYFCGAAIQSPKQLLLPNCPPIRTYLSYLI